MGIRLSELTFSSPVSFLLHLFLLLLFSWVAHLSFSPFPSPLSPANAYPSPKSITFLLRFWFPIFLFLLLLIYADDPYHSLCHATSILTILFLFCPHPFLFLIKKDCLFGMHCPEAIYCWVFPALNYKWSHSAPPITLPHYVHYSAFLQFPFHQPSWPLFCF